MITINLKAIGPFPFQLDLLSFFHSISFFTPLPLILPTPPPFFNSPPQFPYTIHNLHIGALHTILSNTFYMMKTLNYAGYYFLEY